VVSLAIKSFPIGWQVRRRTFCSAFFALGLPLGGARTPIVWPLLLDGARCASAKIAPRETTVRVAVVQAHPAVSVAGRVSLWHEEPPRAVPVSKTVGAVGGALAEDPLRVALVDLPLLVADAGRPIAQQLRSRAQEPVVRLSRVREPLCPPRWPRLRSPAVPATKAIERSELPAAAKLVAGDGRAMERAAAVAGQCQPRVTVCSVQTRIRPSRSSAGGER
jgi:hypothetical protein